MGRASQAIGKGMAGGGRDTRGSRSSGSGYSFDVGSTLGYPRSASRMAIVPTDLGAQLGSAFGASRGSQLAASEDGPTALLSEILEVPDDIDSLIHAALAGSGGDQPDDHSDEVPVESVLYTVRGDETSINGPRVVVEAEVVRAPAFEGRPSLQIRYVGIDGEGGDNQTISFSGGSPRPALGYRPKWTAVLATTPAGLAEQMRVHWTEALEELKEDPDPRLAVFLTGAGGMEAALAVLASDIPTASKYVLLQGLMDPGGQIQYKGISLDASGLSQQIILASEGDSDSLSWLAEVRDKQILTSLSEVTGFRSVAGADYRLSLWDRQGKHLINAVTADSGDDQLDFSSIRSIIRHGEMQRKVNRTLSGAKGLVGDDSGARHSEDHSGAVIDEWSDLGIPEDWFFEETRSYLEQMFYQSIPVQFAMAFVPPQEDMAEPSALAKKIRALITKSSTDRSGYILPHARTEGTLRQTFASLYDVDTKIAGEDRVRRILRAVHAAITAADDAGPDDVGTLLVVHDVLAYAQWKRQEVLAVAQIRKADKRRQIADERARAARRRAKESADRKKQAVKYALTAGRVEEIALEYSNQLARSKKSIVIEDPIPNKVLSQTQSRLEQAKLRHDAASKWMSDAAEHQRWADGISTNPALVAAKQRMILERNLALSEQSEAEKEKRAAEKEMADATHDLGLFAEAQEKFSELIEETRAENAARIAREEAARADREALRQWERERHLQRLREAEQRKEEERRRRQEAERLRREEADRRQTEVNLRQQEKADAAKKALKPQLERLFALPDEAPFWRRRSLEQSKVLLQLEILRLQAGIEGPLNPPFTGGRIWPKMLSVKEQYLGVVEKVVDYGVYVSLPAGVDGLIRGTWAREAYSAGDHVGVEIVDMPYRKPIVLKPVSK